MDFIVKKNVAIFFRDIQSNVYIFIVIVNTLYINTILQV
nr:MAG TPA: hypothetical protein [Bacteriophage sp.]